ncbi:MAG: 3-hydroxyacyl-ACP dehydratase FabZ [Nitrospirae bacterium]|nr:3-hydroxyacyl-ACP dehydratase FabZ [Nitrospirota bacterium]
MTDLNALPVTILPHSYPFVLIDKIIEFEKGKRIICLKNVTINEEFFTGHFRDNPVMPGVLIIEAMAQASGLIIGDEKTGAYLTRVKDARFKKPVIPGDQLIIKSSLSQGFHPLYVFDVMAYVKEEIVSEAEITLTIV